MGKLSRVCKRDGRVAPFEKEKIAEAIFKAARAVGGEDRHLAGELADVVVLFLEKHYPDDGIPGIEDIQDMVEKVLIETGHARTAKAYILYREKRAQARKNAKVRKSIQERDSTDIHLMVDSKAIETISGWDRRLIADALVREAEVKESVADEVASAVEKRILDSGLDRISTSLIRELTDNELFNRGLTLNIKRQATIGMPAYDLERVIFSKSNENSNITVNNPEAINLAIAEHTLKQYALERLFSRDVADAHRKAMIHLHDLGYPVRVYCSSHSLEYLKKYGLRLGNLETSSGPARHARTLTGHLNTFLASMQAYYAGALGVAFINIMYAPLVESLPEKAMHQEAQHLIFSSSQNAFSRGGQTLFLDFNIHTGIPNHLKRVRAIGSDGLCARVEDKDRFVKEIVERKLASLPERPSEKALAEICKEENYVTKDEAGDWVRTYGSYEDAARRFTKAMLRVWREGDQHGHLFRFPKCDFHVDSDTFHDPMQEEILDLACEIASENGVPYFVFDRDAVVLSACCRLRTRVVDPNMLTHPESLRFCGFQNVTINLPQCAVRAGRGNFTGLLTEIENMMDLAMKAHLQKKAFIARLMSAPEMPLWEIGKPAADGRPYIDLDAATYIIGLIGLNECVQYLVGHELHESEETFLTGLKIVGHMYYKAGELSRRHGLKVSLEESPAESAARRFAKVDLARFPEMKHFVRGNPEADEAYYTNSVHLRADAPVDIITRIRKQARFHPLIESGAIIHAFVGEQRPSPRAIKELIRATWKETSAAQLTISPEFTLCGACNRMIPGLKARCPACGKSDIDGRYVSEVNLRPGDRDLAAFEKILDRANAR